MAVVNNTERVLAVQSADQIPAHLRNTPFESMLKFHNLDADFPSEPYASAQLLIIKCMDYRKHMRLPDKFAYIVRNAGANVWANEFSMAFAVAVGQIKHVAIIGHTDCAMVGVSKKKEPFVQGMVERAGWTQAHAEAFFDSQIGQFYIDDVVDFVSRQADQLRLEYPKITVQPFLYKVEDNQLYVINN